MIKLIACDLDGTLLDSQKRLPDRFPGLIDALTERGVLFVPCSGRAVYSLQDSFADYVEQMGFICENGCAVLDRGELVHFSDMVNDEVTELLDEISRVEQLFPVVCGLKGCYVSGGDEEVIEHVRRYFSNVHVLTDVREGLRLDRICKIANVDGIDVLTNSFVRLGHLSDRFTLMPSGDQWLDIVKKGESKGTALRLLMARLGISPDETMAFGDFINDLSLMTACTHSWAMKNGHRDVKAAASAVTDFTNDEDGVVSTIARELNLSI
ncbi:MAG: HAD family hydrolase [Oscillospiraceae bacterium]